MNVDLRPISLVFLLSLVIAGCSRSGGSANAQEKAGPDKAGALKDDPAIRVTTSTVAEKPMPEFLTVTGSLSPNKQTEIAADASGKVISTFVERGQAVKPGEIIATLDARSANLNATALRAQENLARSQADLAKRDCDRGQTLFDTGAISKAEYDRTMAQCNSSRFSVAAAEAQQATAAKTVGDANIRAPFAGVIGERFANVGQYVQPSTRVASLYSVDPLRLELTVPEANVALVHQELPVDFQVAAYGDQRFTGKVRFISPIVRTQSRDLVVEAVVPNAEGKLRPGMFATVKLLVGERPTAVVAPDAVQKNAGAARVYVVSKGHIEERVVQIGETKDGVVAIQGGLKPGEIVVMKPGPEVRDGARVE